MSRFFWVLTDYCSLGSQSCYLPDGNLISTCVEEPSDCPEFREMDEKFKKGEISEDEAKAYYEKYKTCRRNQVLKPLYLCLELN